MIVDGLTRKDIFKIWTTEEFLGRHKKGILVCHNKMKIFSFKSLIRLFKRVIIPRKIRMIIKLPPCVA